MRRNTPTKLGMLREGDRFYFMSDKKPVIRVVIRHARNKVWYNKIKSGTGENAWWFNRSRPIEKPVMFIRHTQLLPGDQCFMYELNDGDVFHKPGDTKYKEMRRVKELPNKQIAVRYVGNPVALHTSPLTTGIFVRRASLKTNTKPNVQ